MGLLVVGTPLAWEDSKQHIQKVKLDGVTQFLALYNRLKDRKDDPLLWGDEIEYLIVSFDDESKNATLSLSQTEILDKLEGVVDGMNCENENFAAPTFHPEFGRFMLESTPGAPYDDSIPSLLTVESNMRLRRRIARHHLSSHEIPMTITSWPRLGTTDTPFSDPHSKVQGSAMQSLFVGDELINEHVRFPTLAANIRRRRGSKVAINLPIFKDTETAQPFRDPTIPFDRTLYPGDGEANAGAAKEDHIYMDAMAFGMGCCCLQVTLQGKDLAEACQVYDALTPVAPIMLALSASSPIYRGFLADVDSRWDVIAGAVDDRTPGERGEAPLQPGEKRILKSRYGSVDSYISSDPANRSEYNDNDVPVDEAVMKRLIENGVEKQLARHIAHLYIRDPLVIFSESLEQDNETSTDHFESIQSTNWQTLRFKPPPSNSPIGWRVEFRSMEVQPTDFENAAYSLFLILLSRAILHFGLNFYIPMSKVDENMRRAQKRDAVLTEKFFFRKSIHSEKPPVCGGINGSFRAENEFEEMTLDEIFNGKGDDFEGLSGLVESYLNTLKIEPKARARLDGYITILKKRASGQLMTPAAYYRHFVRSHPSYKFDSAVSAEVCYDLAKEIDQIERGEKPAYELLGTGYVGSAGWCTPQDR